MSFDLSKAVRLAMIGAGVAAMAACASKPKPQPYTPPVGGPPPRDGEQVTQVIDRDGDGRR